MRFDNKNEERVPSSLSELLLDVLFLFIRENILSQHWSVEVS